jgi:uncharacterized membrane protein YjfL (UPF0719 family)
MLDTTNEIFGLIIIVAYFFASIICFAFFKTIYQIIKEKIGRIY